MPSYTVRDPVSGRSVTLTGDSPPTEQELEEIFASAPAQPQRAPVQQPSFMKPSTAVSTVTGGPVGSTMGRPVEPEKFTNAVRYGAPIAAGFAAAPLTGGMSIPASIATIAGIGAATSGLSEAAAQGMEIGAGSRDGMNYREVGRATMLGGTPIKATGGAAGRLLSNIPSMVLSQEASKFIAGEEAFKKPEGVKEALLTYGIPVVLGGATSIAGGAGRKVSDRVDRANQIRAERFGGEPTLSDILGKQSNLEAKAFLRGNEIATDIYKNISSGVNNAVKQAFTDVPATNEIAADLSAQVGRLTKLEQRKIAAEEASLAAQRRAEDALRSNRLDAPKAVQEAQRAALAKSAEDLIFETRAREFAGVVPQDAADISRMIKPVSDTIKAVDENAASLLTELYGNAGIKLNTPVATAQMVVKELASKRGGGVMSGDIAYTRARELIRSELNAKDGVVTLEAMRSIKDKVAKTLEENGFDRRASNAVAGEVYDAVSKASERFIDAEYGKDVLGKYLTAQQAARANFVAKDADVIRDLVEGNVTGIYNTIKSKGFSESYRQIKAYEDAIIGAADKTNPEALARAQEAAGALRRTVMDSIKGNVLKDASVVGGVANGFEAIDAAKLAQDIEDLRRKGVPVQELGLGDAKKLRSLASIASIQRTSGFTKEQLNTFLKEADVVGADAAAYRAKFRNTFRDELLADNAVQTRRINVARSSDDLRKANFTQRELAAELDAARQDPLVQFMDGVAQGTAPNITRGGDIVQSLFSSDDKVVSGLMRSLESSPERAKYADVLRKNAAAQVFRQFTEEGSKVNKSAIVNFFEGGSVAEERARKSLEAILGSQQYNNLKNSYFRGAKSALASERAMSRSEVAPSGIAGSARVKAVGAGGVAAYTGSSQIMDFLNDRAYNTAYMLYINPKFAPQFAKAGYNIDKFASMQAANAMALRFAQQEDQANRQP